MGCTTDEHITKVFNKLSGGYVERVRKTKDYAFVHFTSREAAEKALLGIKTERGHYLMIDGAEVEVTWSKPVDRYAYNMRKKLTKILTTGSSTNNGITYSMNGVNSQYLLGQIQDGLVRSFVNNVNDNRPIAPRGRGAAGVKGIGAPGTAPPKYLVKTLIGNGTLVDNKTQFLIPSNMPDYPFAPNGYNFDNQIQPLQNSNPYYHHLENPSGPAYTDQYVKALNDMKLIGGACYYPYIYSSAPPPEINGSNNPDPSDPHSGGSSTSSDGNNAKGNNANVVNIPHTQVNLPQQYSHLPRGYPPQAIYYTNPMIQYYNGQYIPVVYNRNQLPPVSSQNQTTPSVRPATNFSRGIYSRISTSNDRNQKARNNPKEIKSH